MRRLYKCIIKECGEHANYYIPSDLCSEHWQMWFDFKLVVVKQNDKKPYAYVKPQRSKRLDNRTLGRRSKAAAS